MSCLCPLHCCPTITSVFHFESNKLRLAAAFLRQDTSISFKTERTKVNSAASNSGIVAELFALHQQGNGNQKAGDRTRGHIPI
jgi:hypothetical protein